MANFCLIPKAVEEFKRGLKEGEIDPLKLSLMDSATRRALLEKYVGKDNSIQVNSLFESKLLLKNQKAGYISWAKKVAGLTSEARRDLISKIEKLDKVLDPAEEKQFLHDLASTKLGTDISFEQAKKITDLSQKVQEANKLMKEDFTFKSEADRAKFGHARVDLANYVNDLKGNNKLTISSFTDIGGLSKSIRASLDNSAIFRQGWKTLLTNPVTWAKNATKSFTDIAKSLKGKEIMDDVMADRESRTNELNGNYKKMKLAVSKTEEAYPTSLPEKIPGFGRLYKASEAAYTGFVYRLRMDLADKYLQIAKDGGTELTPKELESIGSFVNSLTGRGNLGKYEGSAANLVNNVFFSPRNLKAQFDTLGHAITGAGGSNFVRRQAAINLVKITIGIATIMTTANALHPGSAETDPRSSDFGKIKIGDTRFDITGGMSSLITLAARLAPILVGKTPLSKSSTTGQLNPINSGVYGSTTGQDVVVDFMTNKLSPVGQVVRDLLLQKDRDGNTLTLLGELSNLGVPLIGSTYNELRKDPNSAPIILSMIADGLGIATNTYSSTQKSWSINPTKEQRQFKDQVGSTKFKAANDKFNVQYANYVKKTINKDSYKNLPLEDQQSLLKTAKQTIQDRIFEDYGFTYEKEVKSDSQLDTIEALKP